MNQGACFTNTESCSLLIAISGNTSADPDHDSWTHLMEFAFDANPNSFLPDGRYSMKRSGSAMVLTLPVIKGAVSVTDNGLGGDVITLTLPQAPDVRKFARLNAVVVP